MLLLLLLTVASPASRLWPALVDNDFLCGTVQGAEERIQRDLQGLDLPAEATGVHLTSNGNCCSALIATIVDAQGSPLRSFHYNGDCTIISVQSMGYGIPRGAKVLPLDSSADGSAMQAIVKAWPELSRQGPMIIDAAVAVEEGDGWRVHRIGVDHLEVLGSALVDSTGELVSAERAFGQWHRPKSAGASVITDDLLPPAPRTLEQLREERAELLEKRPCQPKRFGDCECRQ